jgi:hypothetical protein
MGTELRGVSAHLQDVCCRQNPPPLESTMLRPVGISYINSTALWAFLDPEYMRNNVLKITRGRNRDKLEDSAEGKEI